MPQVVDSHYAGVRVDEGDDMRRHKKHVRAVRQHLQGEAYVGPQPRQRDDPLTGQRAVGKESRRRPLRTVEVKGVLRQFLFSLS